MTDFHSNLETKYAKLQSDHEVLKGKYAKLKDTAKFLKKTLSTDMNNQKVLMDKYEKLEREHKNCRKQDQDLNSPFSTKASFLSETVKKQIVCVEKEKARCSEAFNCLVGKLKVALEENNQLRLQIEDQNALKEASKQLETLKVVFDKEKLQLNNKIAGLEAELSQSKCTECDSTTAKLALLEEKLAAEQKASLQNSVRLTSAMKKTEKLLESEKAKLKALHCVLTERTGLVGEVSEVEPVPSCVQFVCDI